MNTKTLGKILRVCYLNVEGASRAKGECLAKLMSENNIDVIALQETHIAEETQLRTRGTIPGYKIINSTLDSAYGTATYIRNSITGAKLISTDVSDTGVSKITIELNNLKICNIYKPPSVQWNDNIFAPATHPTLYIGDFNSHHTSWGYRRSDANGRHLIQCCETQGIHLIHDPKDKCTFKSARWSTESNPDLCFVTSGNDDRPTPVNRRVLNDFPHSQHRPILLEIGLQIPVIETKHFPRWNFAKADWENFASDLDRNIRWIPPFPRNYYKFAKMILSTAKKHIPRGVHKEYTPCWNETSEALYEDFLKTGDKETADKLMQSLDETRKRKWIETVGKLDFKFSSRKAWSLLKKLGGNSHRPKVIHAIHPNQICNRIVNMSRTPADKIHTKTIRSEFNTLKKQCKETTKLSQPFTEDEISTAISSMKKRKAPGFDHVHPEFLIHCGKNTKKWLTSFFSFILHTGILPKEFKKSKIIAVLKPGKNAKYAENYRPIALLSATFKLLERLIHNRISPYILETLPNDQAGFRPNRSCEDQVLSLTHYIESGYEKRLKTGAAFIDLTSAFDSVWKEGMLYKLLKTLKCNKIVQLIGHMLSDRTIQVVTENKISKPRKLQNGLPQGSILSPLLFNLYIADQPETVSRKFAYADDLCIATQQVNFNNLEDTLNADLEILRLYFKQWRLIPSPSKTESCCFHLNHRAASTALRLTLDGIPLRHNPTPKYLGIILDRTLTFNKHLSNLAAKLRSRNCILQKIAGTTWGSCATTLRTSALSLVYSTAEYCSTAWMGSVHVKRIDTVLNATMRIISGTLKSTPLYWLPVLSNIIPPSIRRQNNLLREFKKISSNQSLPVHEVIMPVHRRLKSRSPPLVTAKRLLEEAYDGIAAWKRGWIDSALTAWHPLLDPNSPPPGFQLPRKLWVTLNRVRTGHGRCGANLTKWGFSTNSACDCGASLQTTEHITFDCPSRAFGGTREDFLRATPEAVLWLEQLDVRL